MAKLRCSWCDEEFYDFLTPEQIAAVKAGTHVLICPACQALRDKYREEAEEYERHYAAEHARLQAEHLGIRI